MSSYAYVHCKPDGTPFYVGKGALRRVKYLGERNAYHQAVVSKYGKKNILIGMLECSTSDIAFELEKGIIKCLRAKGVSLANFTAGGDGGLSPCEETRKRLSVAAKKRGVSQACFEARNLAKKGKPLSEEHKKKLSAARLGKGFSDEHRKNIRIAAKKRGMPTAVIEAAKVARIGRIVSVDTREKQRIAMLAAWNKKGRKPKKKITERKTCWASRPTRAVYVDGVFYASLKLASAATGLSSSLMIHALKKSGFAKGKMVKKADV